MLNQKAQIPGRGHHTSDSTYLVFICFLLASLIDLAGSEGKAAGLAGRGYHLETCIGNAYLELPAHVRLDIWCFPPKETMLFSWH